MRIGIDFGTSYTAAAAVVEGAIEHISFHGDSQFRTVVFIPETPVDMSQFDESVYELEVANIVRSEKSSYRARLKEYEQRASQIRVTYRKQARDGDISDEAARRQTE